MAGGKAGVLHVVARSDRAALQEVARVSAVVGRQGASQSLAVLDPNASLARRVGRLRARLDQAVDEASLYAVHLHGWDACLHGALALRPRHGAARVLCAPGRPATGWASALVVPVLRARLARFHHALIAGSLAEAHSLSRLIGRSADVLARPVSAAYFNVARRERARPLVAAQICGREAARLATWLSILMNGREPRVDFAWLGAAAPELRRGLEAAQVAALDPAGDEAAAQALSGAWLFVALSPGDELDVSAVHAMAAGVPCLVSDLPEHRALIHHGETGFICASERDFLEKAVLLLRSPAERRRLGEAARAEAGRRFTELNFRRALLRVYGFSPTPVVNRERAACPPLQKVV